MKRRDGWMGRRRIVALLCVAVGLGLLGRAESVRAGEREFLVILATSPKQFNGGLPPGGLPNPQLIRNQYFDKTNPNIQSFAEYWEEISYGDVKISGTVSEWILLPWPIDSANGPMEFVDLGANRYGAGEVFYDPSDPALRDRPMVGVNIGGPVIDPNYLLGAKQTTSRGTPVWTPGERFMDMNGNGVWDGVDEALNAMDWRDNTQLNCNPPQVPCLPPDGKPDLLGPWTDLNGNGVPDNAPGCVYLPDSDNDGNPDCCPNGLGKPGCGFGQTGTGACPVLSVAAPPGTQAGDCNGNRIPDVCDISCTSDACVETGWVQANDPGRVACGKSKDELPYASQGDRCDPTSDGIPDECQFVNPGTRCTQNQLTCSGEQQDPCCTTANVRCESFTPQARCEFDDANRNGVLDIVEPFENYVQGVPFSKSFRFPDPEDPLWVPGADYDAYVRDNYPGANKDVVIRRKKVRVVGGPHDPLNKAPLECTCADGAPCRTMQRPDGGSIQKACPAGVHAEYDPPDSWRESGTAKMAIGNLNKTTPKPDWYEQAWRDRYNNADPPTWVSSGKSAAPMDSLKDFVADRGGLTGRGSGWTTGVDPATVRILPDQMQGIDAPLTVYDGPVEFDDLPSSKYHRTGDKSFGEVTSPFSDDIWGEDRGTNDPSRVGGSDGVIPAAGPYATRLHGQNGRDAGNVLQLEWLTWRTSPPFNNGQVWESLHGSHTYAGPSGDNLGFRDYNLDGLLDLGETRTPGRGNYSNSGYPFDLNRLVEDCVEILDETLDFDRIVDPVAMDAIFCPVTGPFFQSLPVPYQGDGPIPIAGVVSGIVLLPPGSPGFPPAAPTFRPVHNEDGLNDAVYASSNFPKPPKTPQLNWNIWFHNLVHTLGSVDESDVSTLADFAIGFASHEYGHAWQHFLDLYDYDSKDGGGIVNCPIGAWDIMANGGLVHPIPALKESSCTKWIETVDLTTVLTPGVSKTITFPSAESIRDSSYYFLQNEDRLGEKYYFWSAGNGFDVRMPGEGLLVLHADPNGSNPDAIALQQRSGHRPAYKIVQADGLAELESGPGVDPACGDAGDPWPGSTNSTEFDCSTLPASEWYDDACTGLEIRDIVPDGLGSTRVTFNWTPTNLPSLRFINPPGGVTVGNTYQIRSEATDVYGGTWVRYFYTQTETATPIQTDGTAITLVRKTTLGTIEQSVNWNVSGLSDGRYFIFADLIPDRGADGTEAKLTTPRAGRNNVGTAGLAKADVIVDVSTISNGVVTRNGKARSETWVAECIDATNGKWVVSSSLTQPLAPAGASPAICTATPELCAATGTQYTSKNGAVKFTIKAGTGAQAKGAVGDTFTFTTTGLTAPSAAVTITGGQIREDPIAIIDASPLSGLPPLTVSFDARRSRDPNGQPLTFTWTISLGGTLIDTLTGPVVTRVFNQAGTFTVTLTARNPSNGRFGETAVDIEVINNSPKAVIKANPSSGGVPLTVHFSAGDSSDVETPANQLIYQWNFGDGTTANDQRTPGILRETDHLYSRLANGTLCTTTNPCQFTATLTVIDSLEPGGKSDTDQIVISVGNTNPVANVSFSNAQGNSPLVVTFNAKSSTDADGDTLTVEWTWGDGSAVETYPAKTGKPPATDGSVPHTYTLAAGQTSATFKPTAKIKDGRGGETTWAGVTITVTAAGPTDSSPRALFSISPAQPLLNQEFTVDASLSFDRPTGGRITAYDWEWGDGSARSTGVTANHKYTRTGRYTITLTVSDAETPPNKATTTKTLVISSEAPPPTGTNRAPTASLVVNPLEGFVDDVFTFDARGSTDPDGDTLSYRFVFGDGDQAAFGASATTTHRYAAAGTYLVRLTVRDELNASTDLTRSIRVLLPGENRTPIALIATGPRTGAAPLTLTFDGRISYDPDDDPITYTWTFTLNGAVVDTLTGSVATRLFDETGTYTVVLAVADPDGAIGFSDPVTVVVTERGTPIEPPPAAPRPTPEPPPPSYLQRPTQICGVGMLMGVFGSLLGLTTIRGLRRDRTRA